jgi:signal transduction histidine kinase
MQQEQDYSLSHLANYLSSHKNEIIKSWVDSVDKDVDIQSSNNLTYTQLLDHLPSLFDEMCDLLRDCNNSDLKTDVKTESKSHGKHRWSQGYKIDELLREIEIIRKILLVDWVTNFGAENPEFGSANKKRAKAIIHNFFGDLTIHSVKQFVEERENELLDYNRRVQQSHEKLQQIDRARQLFTRTLSHELRNILNPMKMVTAILSNNIDETAKNKMLGILNRNINDMTNLLNQLLDYSSLLAGQTLPVWECLEVRPVFDELVGRYEMIAQAKGLKFEAQYQLDAQFIESDQLKLKQIISNLLSNAIKYTEQGQVRFLVASESPQHLSIVVEDTGMGIEPEDLTHLFEEFHRSKNAMSLPGTGLGLAITKRLIDLLNGHIKVESEVNQGSRFTVVLPVKQ